MDNTKKNDRRISIVLNGQEKVYEELKKDKQSYDELLNAEISATTEEEQQSEEFDWILSEPSTKQPSRKVVDLGERRRDKQKLGGPFWDDGKSEDSPKLPHIKRKKNRRFDFSSLPLGLIGIIMSAIIVGVSFGFMMLTIFTGEKVDPVIVDRPLQTATPTDIPVTVTPGQVPILGVEVVQGGAFSLATKGEEVATAIKDQGFAAAITSGTEPVFLFIGLGLDKEQANVVASKYKDSGQEVYLKPYAVTATGTVETQDQALYLETAVDVYQQLTLLAVNGLANGGSLLTEETLTELTSSFEKLISIGDPFTNNQTQQLKAMAFQDNLTSAYQEVNNFAISKEEATLWQVQQHLLNGLISYEELTKTFN
ncbi:hypothetical protein AWH56_014855 [Anaerobacillus isosaccharinicus]|uniref:SPOR domain-containing protein n=1 Tax=Anaerobacillus isosaccharinicus TaxID=1532552 RepID=A0A1S2ME21_9BACI|nr:hypothetical protein [Anaerobacillus isosaccharinicus]MBA5587823.1 hypothetical protein [Anaerobacillus isosaccharinicus]QOY34023.1 hypothetical protein AWH56_014855 [Anaerobacillus isosaccharinicus]